MFKTATDRLKGQMQLGSISDYFALLKPRVMSLAIFTALCGQILALKQNNIHPVLFLVSLLSIALGAGAAGCINMWYDKDIDAKMRRTKSRPIPSGIIKPDEALGLGIILSILSVVLLGLASNILASFLLASSILFYIFIYTIWLKRKTYQNIVVGGAAGALPPLIGWVSVTNQITIFPIVLFLIIFIWTPPHFWALSLFSENDYEKAGIPMLPNVLGRTITKKSIIKYSYFLYLSSLLPYLLGFSGNLYLFISLLFNTFFIYLAYNVDINNHKTSRKLFKFSIIYLFIIFVSLVTDNLFNYYL
mgnify:FL=1|tara:strand:+ start:1705 stop:2616 length:912 start_codon:yes stop_codon:yes gene_type:complete